MSKSITVESKAIRCHYCDKLLAQRPEKVALAEFYEYCGFYCKACYDKYHGPNSEIPKSHIERHRKVENHFQEGDDLSEYKKWVVFHCSWI